MKQSIRGRFYRLWSRLIHRFNYHHMELSYPGGDVVAWCHWCGLRDRVYDEKRALAGLKAATRSQR